jgi:hypothetical protein
MALLVEQNPFLPHRGSEGEVSNRSASVPDRNASRTPMKVKTPVPTAQQLFFPTVPVDPATQEERERVFFATIRQHNGTYKYTYANRLDDLNTLVAGLLPPPRPVRLMDVAVSSGITTLDWVNSLDRLGIPYTMTAGDLNLCAYLMSLGRHLKVLVDNSGHPLQYDIFGQAVTNPPRRRMLPVFLPWIFLFKLALAFKFQRARDVACQGVEHEYANSGIRCRLVTLASPRLVGNDRIELIEDDILNNHTIRGRYHVIRAANILNRSYFDEPALVAILRNLRQRLVEGGRLVVCSTTGDEYGNRAAKISNDATVFALRPDKRFEVAGRLGMGSVLEDLVLDLQPTEVQSSLRQDARLGR